MANFGNFQTHSNAILLIRWEERVRAGRSNLQEECLALEVQTLLLALLGLLR